MVDLPRTPEDERRRKHLAAQPLAVQLQARADAEHEKLYMQTQAILRQLREEAREPEFLNSW